MTIQELFEILMEYDVGTLAERLHITPEEFLGRFHDKIEDNFEELVEEETGES